ncbi:MAG: hypothetical protein KC457_25960, partial [Myxococcales bacterium]|nr:hypothetical protein [Myxococcales bacterium]
MPRETTSARPCVRSSPSRRPSKTKTDRAATLPSVRGPASRRLSRPSTIRPLPSTTASRASKPAAVSDAPATGRPLRLGTRASALALWQANHVRDSLLAAWPGTGLQIELVEITTEGDRILDRPLNEVGGKGLFVKGIEELLLAGRIDFAVHSMKDLPGHLPSGLHIACTPERADPRDALIGPAGVGLSQLPAGTRL